MDSSVVASDTEGEPRVDGGTVKGDMEEAESKVELIEKG